MECLCPTEKTEFEPVLGSADEQTTLSDSTIIGAGPHLDVLIFWVLILIISGPPSILVVLTVNLVESLEVEPDYLQDMLSCQPSVEVVSHSFEDLVPPDGAIVVVVVREPQQQSSSGHVAEPLLVVSHSITYLQGHLSYGGRDDVEGVDGAAVTAEESGGGTVRDEDVLDGEAVDRFSEGGRHGDGRPDPYHRSGRGSHVCRGISGKQRGQNGRPVSPKSFTSTSRSSAGMQPVS